MVKRTMKKEYNVEPFTITPQSVKNFKIIDSRRQISEGHVSKIHGALLQGKNPMGVIIVNRINGQDRLIDGNHGIEAIKKFYELRESNKAVEVECVLKVYRNLNEDEERQVYSDEAKRRNESYEDRLNIYKDTIIFWKLLQDRINSFPCQVTIYPTKNSIKFRVILNAMNTTKNGTSGGYRAQYLNKEELVEFAKTLTYDDFVKLKDFITFFQEVYGKVSPENLFTRSQFFLPLFDIYCKNIHHAAEPNFKERMARIIGRADLIGYANVASRETQTKIRNIMVGYMNHSISKNFFV